MVQGKSNRLGCMISIKMKSSQGDFQLWHKSTYEIGQVTALGQWILAHVNIEDST